MQPGKIAYKIKSALAMDICSHLNQCNTEFIPTLSEKVDIDEYSKKIFDKAITFEAWQNDVLAGLVAAYFNISEQFAFITNVSVLMKFNRLGIASELIRICIGYATENGITQLILEVNKKNMQAINFYKKMGFAVDQIKAEQMVLKLQL